MVRQYRTEQYVADGKEYHELLKLTDRNEEKLLSALTDEQKELFRTYTDSVREFHSRAERLLFKSSFSHGARMMLDSFIWPYGDMTIRDD